MQTLFTGTLTRTEVGSYENKPQFTAIFERQLNDEAGQPVSREIRSVAVRPEAFEEVKRFEGKSILLAVKVRAWKTGKGVSYYDAHVFKSPKAS
jgi:hypothetical protein